MDLEPADKPGGLPFVLAEALPQGDLFRKWKKGDISCFVCLGGCRDQHEAAFLKYLTALPADVLILVPDRADRAVFRIRFCTRFPARIP